LQTCLSRVSYGFDMSMVGGVHQLVSKAIRLGDTH